MNRVGYGAMQLAGPNVWGLPADPQAARRLLRLAVEWGVTFFDTANAYGPRTVNQLIGQALRPFPDGVIVGNKVGAGRGGDGSWIITDHPDIVRRQVLADCETHGILFIPYFPLASGQLAGYDELVGPAQRLGVTAAQVALGWLLRRSSAIVVIPGTSNPAHLRANIAAAEVAASLTDAEVTRLTDLIDESKAVLNQPHQSTIDAHQASADTRR
jgi:aryl-alcohol dehydrogenase-like predicted oxidoreductase